MNDRSLIEVQTEAAYHLEKIQKLFKPGTKVTLIVRPKMHKVEGDTDFVLLDDNIDEAIKVLQRRKIQGDEYGQKKA